MTTNHSHNFIITSLVSFWFRISNSSSPNFPKDLINIISNYSKIFLKIDIFRSNSKYIKVSRNSKNNQIIKVLNVRNKNWEDECVLCSKAINKSNYGLYKNIKIQIKNKKFGDNIAIGFVSKYEKNKLLQWPITNKWRADAWVYHSYENGYIYSKVENNSYKKVKGEIGGIKNDFDVMSFSLDLSDESSINCGRFIVNLNGKMIGNVSGVNINKQWYFVIGLLYDVESETEIVFLNE